MPSPLQLLRSQHNLSQRQVAAALGIWRDRYSRWEQRQSPTVDQVMRVSIALGPLLWQQYRSTTAIAMHLSQQLEDADDKARCLLLLAAIARGQTLYSYWAVLGQPVSLADSERALGLYPSRRRASLERCDRKSMAQLRSLGQAWADAMPDPPAGEVLRLARCDRDLALLLAVGVAVA